jgi:long-chain acyl-CoA synthetase
MSHDPVPTLAAVSRFWGRWYGSSTALRATRPGRWSELTYAELAEAVDEVGRGLVGLDVGPGDRVAILSANRPEWTVSDLAVLAAGAVTVPLDPTADGSEWVDLLADSGASVLICENVEQLARIGPRRSFLPRLATTVVMDPDGRPDVVGLTELAERGRTVDPLVLADRSAAVHGGQVASITYGRPGRGCVSTQDNWRAALDGMWAALPITSEDTVMLQLPLHGALGRLIQYDALGRGALLRLCPGGARTAVTELGQVRPEFLAATPEVYEQVHAQAADLLDRVPAADRHAFQRAVTLGREVRGADEHGLSVPSDRRRDFAVADTRWLARVREVFGGRLRAALSGGGGLAYEALDFLWACGISVDEAYGSPTTTGIATLNAPGLRRLGTFGRPIGGVEVRIAHDGEVLVQGGTVFLGYYRNPTATREALVDGWLRTGDLGELDAEGYLRVTGRREGNNHHHAA